MKLLYVCLLPENIHAVLMNIFVDVLLVDPAIV